MKYLKDTLDFRLEKRSVVTLGKFDGLHRGHTRLLEEVKKIAENKFETVVFTFDVSPVVKLGTKITRTLITNEERRRLLEAEGIDCLVECPFVPELIQMSPENFVREILVSQLQVAYVVVGEDFRFGYQREGDCNLLCRLGERYGYQVKICSKEQEVGADISSTAIRQLLREGNMEAVQKLLGYPYFVTGPVVHGRHLGRTWGLPTINQIPEKGKLLPPFGVYATRTLIGEKEFFGISNVGVKPTVEVPFAGVETYLFDCDEDLYGQDAWVEFYHFVRPECKFDSLEELKEQIQHDAQTGKAYFHNVRNTQMR